MESVKVIAVEDFAGDDETYDWAAGAEQIKQAIGKPIHAVFSSEAQYSPIFQQLYPDANHILIDQERERYPISATDIRLGGPYRYWDFLPKEVQSYFVKKVVIVGTESCGKSTLTKYLAKLYNTTYTEEFGRIFCEELGGCDNILIPEDFQRIAFGHKMLEYEAVQKANKVVFIDTEALITQYYANLYLNHHQTLLDEIASVQSYDLWLFLEPDVPWVDDELRVHGREEERKKNNDVLKNMLEERNIPLYFIRGCYEERLKQAMILVDELLEV